MINRLNKLKKTQAKTTAMQEPVSTSILDKNRNFPLLIKPQMSDLNLRTWITEHMDQFNSNLSKHGAILCRGFSINTVDKFHELMALFPEKALEYKMRSSPRYNIKENVYVSTTHPQDQSIEMHSESSYAPAHPARITFCCIKAATEQGETPIADNRQVLDNLSNTTRKKFEEKGVRYRRNLNPRAGLSWQEVFQTDNKAVVEQECKDNNMGFEWSGDDMLITSWTKPAVWKHPDTGEDTWFNHGLFFNRYALDDEILKSFNSFDDLPNDTFYGDGTQISKDEIAELKAAYKKALVVFPWQEGDVLFLDNMLCSHGRNPFRGERKIIVSIA